MVRKKKNNKRIKLIIVLVIILAIILLLKYCVENRVFDRRHSEFEIFNSYQGNPNKIELREELKIDYKNIDVLSGLNGELPVSTVTKKINEIFLINIPKYMEETKDMNDEQLSNYFNNNKNQILKELRIDNEKSFINMINVFTDIDMDKSNDDLTCRFLKGSYIRVEFTYGIDKIIEFKLKGNNAEEIIFEF